MSVSALAGSALGGVFGAMASLRRKKPLHPHGVVYDAVVRRTGASRPYGARWLDDSGEDRAVVRISRAAGLPRPLPDVLGLALRFAGEKGELHDLLLATTGTRPGARFLLLPRRDALAVPYGSLLPYRTGTGSVLIAAEPTACDGAIAAFRLVVAGPWSPWRQFATLELTRERDVDEPIRFDPVTNELPGLTWPPGWARLREPAYAAARRRASAGDPVATG